jgi:hypothetical protein
MTSRDQPHRRLGWDSWGGLAEELHDDFHASSDLRARHDLFLSVMSSYEGQIDKGTRLIV